MSHISKVGGAASSSSQNVQNSFQQRLDRAIKFKEISKVLTNIPLTVPNVEKVMELFLKPDKKLVNQVRADRNNFILPLQNFLNRFKQGYSDPSNRDPFRITIDHMNTLDFSRVTRQDMLKNELITLLTMNTSHAASSAGGGGSAAAPAPAPSVSRASAVVVVSSSSTGGSKQPAFDKLVDELNAINNNRIVGYEKFEHKKDAIQRYLNPEESRGNKRDDLIEHLLRQVNRSNTGPFAYLYNYLQSLKTSLPPQASGLAAAASAQPNLPNDIDEFASKDPRFLKNKHFESPGRSSGGAAAAKAGGAYPMSAASASSSASALVKSGGGAASSAGVTVTNLNVVERATHASPITVPIAKLSPQIIAEFKQGNMGNLFDIMNQVTVNRPYDVDTREKVSLNGKTAFRPNHNGTHGARQARMTQIMLEDPTVVRAGTFTAEEKCHLILAAYCLRIGRVDESSTHGGGADTNVGLRSSQIYEAYAKQLGASPAVIENTKLLVHYAVIPFSSCPTSVQTQFKTGSKLSTAKNLLSTAHEFDLLRVGRDYINNSGLSQKVRNRFSAIDLARYGAIREKLFKATGVDPVGAGNQYQNDKFIALSASGIHTWQAVSKVS